MQLAPESVKKIKDHKAEQAQIEKEKAIVDDVLAELAPVKPNDITRVIVQGRSCTVIVLNQQGYPERAHTFTRDDIKTATFSFNSGKSVLVMSPTFHEGGDRLTDHVEYTREGKEKLRTKKMKPYHIGRHETLTIHGLDSIDQVYTFSYGTGSFTELRKVFEQEEQHGKAIEAEISRRIEAAKAPVILAADGETQLNGSNPPSKIITLD